ncbi:MAG: insulinase family protein [Candidatus Zixiibacteriota bacterium]|nr:MAG: insulinase family protein [candidate division Zixibacteria bacterium]
MRDRLVKSLLLLLWICLIFTGCEKMKTDGVTRTVLDNGLTVLIEERHSAPVVAINTWVRTGYFNEPDSLTGISHLLEHMFFKGTEKRKVGELREDTKRLGGYLNGGTIYEYTNYYTILPSTFVQEGLEIQSDALWNSVIDSAELAKEKDVVIQEVKRKLDNPNALAWEKLMELAFDHHPLRRWRMGTPDQISGWSRDDLESYFKKFYRPDNIVLAIVGDVRTSEVLEGVKRHYARVEMPETERLAIPQEPEQSQLRYLQMKGDITQTYLKIGFHMPGELDSDFFALDVLAHILGHGRSSRLSQSLIEQKRLVNSVSSSVFGLKDFGVFLVEAGLDTEDLQEAEVEIFRQIERLKKQQVPYDELFKAKNAIKFSHLSSVETVRGQSFSLAAYEAYGDYRLAQRYLENVDRVTAEDVHRVASKYLVLENASIIENRPESESDDDMSAGQIEETIREGLAERTTEDEGSEGIDLESPRTEGASGGQSGDPTSGSVDVSASSHVLSCGATLITRENHSLPLVSLGVYFKGGRVRESEKNCGITRLMLRGSLKGTANRTGQEIFNSLEALGASINTEAEPDYFGYLIKILSTNLGPGLDIIADVIKNPLFDPEELEKEKEILVARIERNKDNMRDYSIRLFHKALFEDHPYGLNSLGEEEAVRGLGESQVKRWREQHVSSGNMTVVAVGDFDSSRLKEKLDELFEDLRAGEIGAAEIEQVDSDVEKDSVTETRRKAQTAQALGFATCSYKEEDFYALKVLQGIASGTGGRFFHQLREKEALAYTVYGVNRSWGQAGAFYAYIATSPENEELAREKLLDEFDKFKIDPVTDEELEVAKNYIAGMYKIYLETNSAMVRQYAKAHLLGKGIEEVERYPEKVARVTKEEINEVAARYFDPKSLAVGAIRGTR